MSHPFQCEGHKNRKTLGVIYSLYCPLGAEEFEKNRTRQELNSRVVFALDRV